MTTRAIEHSEAVASQTESHSDREPSKIIKGLDGVSKWILLAVAFLLPTLVITGGGIELARATVFGILIFIAFGAELIKILLTGRILYIASPLNWAVAVFLGVLGVSTYVSPASSAAFLGTDILAERFMSVSTFVLAYVLVIVSTRKKNDSLLFALSLIGGGALSGIVSFLGFFGVHMPFVPPSGVNVIGTPNALALFYVFLTMLTAGLMVGLRKEMRSLSIFLRTGLWCSLGIFFLNLAAINFLNAWIVFLAASAVFAWMYLATLEGMAERSVFHDRYAYMVLGLCIVPLLFIFIQVPLFSGVYIPSEASPTFRATVDIAKKNFSQSTRQTLFGTGPGTFKYLYSAFKDPAVNTTDFWGVRFGQGYSLFSSVLATTGILGFLAYVGVFITACISIGRAVIRRNNEYSLLHGYASGSAVLLLAWLAYPATYSLLLALFAMLGFSVAVLSGAAGFGRSDERRIEWRTPWATFAASLFIAVLLMAFVGGIFTHVERYRAALFLESAVTKLQQKGDIDGGFLDLQRAADTDMFNDQYSRFLVQGHMLKIQNIISSTFGTAPSAAIQGDFQREVSAAIDAAKRSLQINPLESFNWRTAGSLYEALIPFVSGADQSAINAYAQAAKLDPANPSVFVEIGRIYTTIADVAENLARQQANSEEEARTYAEARVKALESAGQTLQKAVELKNDLASAHFLLAQIALRQGNVRAAIESTDRAQRAAPNDIGILFQLGLLYYQNNQFPKAEEAFSRALALNEQYSNARYFLGLIVDRRGQTEEAIKHFERIEALNPENQDVKKILENLRAGKPALSAVAPSEKEAPIKEKEGKEQTPIKTPIKATIKKK